MNQRIKTLPRWIIFGIDLSLIAFSVVLARFLKHNFSLSETFDRFLPGILGFVLILNALLFWVFKNHVGIVRYTNVRDTARILGINVIASFIYFLCWLYFNNQGDSFLSSATIAINFYTASFALIGYRILVRHLFRVVYQDVRKEKRRAAIYDAGEQGLLLKRVFSDYSQSTIKIVAFLDDTTHKQGKGMDSLPIYNTELSSFEKLKNDGVTSLIVANRNITAHKLNELVEKGLEFGIKTQQVPPVEEWLHGKLDTTQLKDVRIEDLLEREVINIDNEKIFFSLKNKKILVTGAAGSIGSEMVRQLTKFKPTLIILCDVAESPLHELTLEMQEKFPAAIIKSYIGDICDRMRMEHLFEIYNPEIVFHAAAYKHVPLMEDHPSVAVINNVLGTKTLAEISVINRVEKFVMVSTDKAVNPTNVMGASKRIAEIFTQSYYRHLIDGNPQEFNDTRTRFITTRFGNVLGSNGSVIPRFQQQIEQGGPLTVTHPEITRYFMTIPEACQLVIEAGVMGNGGEIFVFDMGEPVKIVDLAHKMIRLSGKTPNVDVDVVFTGLRPGEKLFEELLSTKENTVPTYHEKILIAKVREYNFGQIDAKINKLISLAQKHYTYETVSMMKEMVPEFISNNSSFEKLDVKIAKKKH